MGSRCSKKLLWFGRDRSTFPHEDTHSLWMLCSMTLRFKLFKALLASTRRTPSLSRVKLLHCMNSCLTARFCRAQSCAVPATDCISGPITTMFVFPIILRRVSHTPIGRTPGFFDSGISRQDINGRMQIGINMNSSNSPCHACNRSAESL